MQINFVNACAATFLCLQTFGVAQAATINIVRSDGTPFESVYGLRDNTGTEGADLAGAVITANYANGTSENIVWEPVTDFSYSIDGFADGIDTYAYMNWDGFELQTSSLLTSIVIDVAPAHTVFDTIDTRLATGDPLAPSTTGSSFGFPFELYSEYQSLTGNIDVTYFGIVNLAGAPAAGDLYTSMFVDFSGLSTGGIDGEIGFRSDLDTMRYVGDLVAVPLPASLPLLLVGLGGLALGRRARSSRV